MSVLVALLHTRLLLPLLGVVAVVWVRYHLAQRREPHLRDVVAEVAEPPRRDHSAAASEVGGWKTVLQYDVGGRAWRHEMSLAERFAVGSAVALRYDERDPGRVSLAAVTAADSTEPWRTAWLVTAFAAVVLAVAVWQQVR